MKIKISRSDGGTSYMHLVEGAKPEDEIAKWEATHAAYRDEDDDPMKDVKAVSWVEVEETDGR